MKLVVFGLTMSSSWGNGHATLWRGLSSALGARGHEVVFFEKDVPYYAAHRDFASVPYADLVLYREWEDVLLSARRHVEECDAAIVTSFCPDAVAAAELVRERALLRVFYDMDTPVTLAALDSGSPVPYLGPWGLSGFDLVLSFTGGPAVRALRERLGAARVQVLYGHVDPTLHRPVAADPRWSGALSYLGTYCPDRHSKIENLLVEPARRLPHETFTVGGSMYPDFEWPTNVRRVAHVSPAKHPAFYCSSRLTLNVTRRAMARMGHCPSTRLFEAAACGVPIVSDEWEGLDAFFEPKREILVVSSAEDVVAALSSSERELSSIARAARERTLAEHTAERRALELERALEAVNAARCTPSTGSALAPEAPLEL